VTEEESLSSEKGPLKFKREFIYLSPFFLFFIPFVPLSPSLLSPIFLSHPFQTRTVKNRLVIANDISAFSSAK
jgi:hypothetical protein